jgi:hypothetical protein
MPGEGKSTTATYIAKQKKDEYGRLKVYSNMDVSFQDGEISKWTQLMEYNNGEYGQVYILDEVSSLLNSRAFKDFPPDVLDLITQSRKVRTKILYTTQDIKFVDVNLRRLTKEIWRPMTFLKTICFVRVYKPIINSEGNVEKKKLKRIFFYRHDSALRDSFDTMKQIAILKREGFAPRSEQIRPDIPKGKQEIVIKDKKTLLKK